MTTNQVQLVQHTFGVVAQLPTEVVGSLFYNQLFAVSPELRPLFSRTAMPEQSRKLLTMLAYVVGHLNTPDQIATEVAGLARRHVRYGVTDGHYALVGDALLWTLEKGLGEAWTEDTKAAWIACYTFLSTALIEAANETPMTIQ